MNTSSPLPVAVIGAGPIGLAAAAHLVDRGMSFVLLEAGTSVGATMREWSHVRMFSPWEFNIDPTAERLLYSHGWASPAGDTYPTGGELVQRYLVPLSRLPEIAPHLQLQARVVGVSRRGRDKMKSDAGRAVAPFRIRFETPAGEQELLARAVLDTAGTWRGPNPL